MGLLAAGVNPIAQPVCPFPRSWYPKGNVCATQEDLIGEAKPIPQHRNPPPGSADIVTPIVEFADRVGGKIQLAFFAIVGAVAIGLFLRFKG